MKRRRTDDGVERYTVDATSAVAILRAFGQGGDLGRVPRWPLALVLVNGDPDGPAITCEADGSLSVLPNLGVAS